MKNINWHLLQKKPSTKKHKYPKMDSSIPSVVLWISAIFLHTTTYFRGKMVKGVGGWAAYRTNNRDSFSHSWQSIEMSHTVYHSDLVYFYFLASFSRPPQEPQSAHHMMINVSWNVWKKRLWTGRSTPLRTAENWLLNIKGLDDSSEYKRGQTLFIPLEVTYEAAKETGKTKFNFNFIHSPLPQGSLAGQAWSTWKP